MHAAPGLSCSMWGLVPGPGIEPGRPALGVWSLTHWTTREFLFKKIYMLFIYFGTPSFLSLIFKINYLF